MARKPTRLDDLVTSRLRLGKWRAEDRQAYRLMCADVEVMRYLGGPQSEREADEDLEWFRNQDPSYRPIRLLDDDRFAGFCGFIRLHRSESPGLAGELEIGWRFVRSEWKKGLATEAATGVLSTFYRSLFDKGGPPRLVSRVHKENVNSIRLLERLGLFRDETLEGPEEYEEETHVYTASIRSLLKAVGVVPRRDAPPDALECWAARNASAARKALRLTELAAFRKDQPLLAIKTFFGIKSEENYLQARELDWLRLLEPQTTATWAHFLSSGGRNARKSRVIAFYRALSGSTEGSLEEFNHFEVLTEIPVAHQQRLDLAVRLDRKGGQPSRWIGVELKLGHALLNDLNSYQAIASPGEPAEYFVLATNREERLLEFPAWTFVGWRKFLERFERFLPREHDDPMFRAFRRATFLRATYYAK